MKQILKVPHSISTQEVLQRIESRENGLEPSEILKKLRQFRKNEIPLPGKKPFWKIILSQLNNLMVYIIPVVVIISFLTYHYVDFYVILAIIMIKTSFGFVQELRAKGALEALKNLLIQRSKVIRCGILQTIHTVDLVPEYVIVLEEGDNVPVVAGLIYDKNARVTESTLTDEAIPVEKFDTALPKETDYPWFLPQGIKKARTLTFKSLAFSQLFNAINLRNSTGSVSSFGIFSNKWLNYALLISALITILIIEVPILAYAFKFQPISLGEFLLWAGLSSLVFWATEIFKYFKISGS